MGMTAQRMWRRKAEERRLGRASPSAPQLPTLVPREQHERIVQELTQGYERKLAALRAEGGDGEGREVVATTAEAQALIDSAKVEFQTWADELRTEIEKARGELAACGEELAKVQTSLEQVTAERDELAELLEQATDTPDGDVPATGESGTGGAEAPSTDTGGEAPSAATAAADGPPAAPDAAAPPAGESAAKPQGKGGKGSRAR